jgi:1,4-dihydroxy-2-naphthoate octaprenyltransferase
MIGQPPSKAEPRPEQFASAIARFAASTRPAFLSVTVVGVCLGLACAYHDLGRLDAVTALVTLLFAALAHAGVNVVTCRRNEASGFSA